MDQVRISVVIPVYNVEKYLDECLTSIVSQSFSDIEIICVDDGSTDGSADILARFASEDSRIKVITQSNAGAGVARNIGLEIAIGDYVIFFDADDYMSVDALQLLYDCAVANSSEITVGRSCRYQDEEGVFEPMNWSIRGDLIEYKRCFHPMDYADYVLQIFIGWPWDKLYSRSFIKEKSLTFPALRHSEDTAFVRASVALAKCVAIVNDVIFTHRMHAASLINQRHLDPTCFYDALNTLSSRVSSTYGGGLRAELC